MAKQSPADNLVDVTCVSCGGTLRVGRKFIGRHGRCPHCHTKFLIAEPKPGAERKRGEGHDVSALAPQVDTAKPRQDDEYEETPSFAVVLPWWESLAERVKVAAPCWVISLAVHVALLILLAVMTVAVPQRENEGIQVNVQLKAEENKKEVYLDKKDIQNRLDDMLPQRTSAFADAATPSVGITSGADTSGVVPIIGIAGSMKAGGGSPFAVATGPVSFFGSGGGKDVSSVVFVVDRSASMEGERLEMAKAELLRSIERLTVANMFNVIFFSDQTTHKPCWPQLVLAITERKRECQKFIKDMSSYGGTEPATAMEMAIKAKPDLIFFLTDGEFDRGVVALIQDYQRRYAKEKKVRINTIAFKDRGGERMLRQIAAQNEGTYRFVK